MYVRIAWPQWAICMTTRPVPVTGGYNTGLMVERAHGQKTGGWWQCGRQTQGQPEEACGQCWIYEI